MRVDAAELSGVATEADEPAGCGPQLLAAAGYLLLGVRQRNIRGVAASQPAVERRLRGVPVGDDQAFGFIVEPSGGGDRARQ